MLVHYVAELCVDPLCWVSLHFNFDVYDWTLLRLSARFATGTLYRSPDRRKQIQRDEQTQTWTWTRTRTRTQRIHAHMSRYQRTHIRILRGTHIKIHIHLHRYTRVRTRPYWCFRIARPSTVGQVYIGKRRHDHGRFGGGAGGGLDNGEPLAKRVKMDNALPMAFGSGGFGGYQSSAPWGSSGGKGKKGKGKGKW